MLIAQTTVLLKQPHVAHFVLELRTVLRFAVRGPWVIGIDGRAIVFVNADVMAARSPVTGPHRADGKTTISEFVLEGGHAGG